MKRATVKKALMVLEWAYGRPNENKRAYYEDWLVNRDWDEEIFTRAVGAMPADVVYKGLPPLADIKQAYKKLRDTLPVRPGLDDWQKVFDDLPDYWQLMVAWHKGMEPDYLRGKWPELYEYLASGKEAG